jgi:hypothetical protein
MGRGHVAVDRQTREERAHAAHAEINRLVQAMKANVPEYPGRVRTLIGQAQLTHAVDLPERVRAWDAGTKSEAHTSGLARQCP